MKITQRPLAAADVRPLWEFMLEFPRHNFDDGGPHTLEQFEQAMVDRVQHEVLAAFTIEDDNFIGAAAYRPFSPRSGVLRGVCFARRVHGTGIPLEAMRGFIEGLGRDGAEKVSAQLHADNTRAWRFFKKLGFVQEGLFRAHTTRAGDLIDLRIIALFKKDKVD
ncbi:MAG: GNAT family protein [Pseudomonadota bacterium]